MYLDKKFIRNICICYVFALKQREESANMTITMYFHLYTNIRISTEILEELSLNYKDVKIVFDVIFVSEDFVAGKIRRPTDYLTIK